MAARCAAATQGRSGRRGRLPGPRTAGAAGRRALACAAGAPSRGAESAAGAGLVRVSADLSAADRQG
mgnify:CR=1 FL=1